MADEFKANEIEKFLTKSWYTPLGLTISLIISNLTLIGLASQLDSMPGWISVTFILACNFIIPIVWILTKRPPKAEHGKLGFLVSISYSDDDESKKLQDDFIIPLKNLVHSGRAGNSISFIELPQRFARNITKNNSQLEIRKISSACRCHFALYGRVRYRKLAGKERLIIELDGIVSHAPIDKSISDQLAAEFTELLPRRVNFDSEIDLIGFDFTSEWVDIVARYIIGIAAAFSGDLDYAETLYLDTKDRLAGKREDFPVYKKITERLPIRISELHEARARMAFHAWTKLRDQNSINLLGRALALVDKTRKEIPEILNIRAIYIVIIEKNASTAIALLKKLKAIEEPVWNYNMAFLHCYHGNLKLAIRHYRKALLKPVNIQIINQIEDFYYWIIAEEPNKYQLYYGFGFFEWKTKGDLIQAKKDLSQFIKNADSNKYESEIQLANKWLTEIELEAS